MRTSILQDQVLGVSKVTGREPSIFFALLLVLSNAQFQKVTPEMTVFQTSSLQTVLESLLKKGANCS